MCVVSSLSTLQLWVRGINLILKENTSSGDCKRHRDNCCA
jgi:hypothetical protein